jgi:methyl-accepting chemotaxis protein
MRSVSVRSTLAVGGLIIAALVTNVVLKTTSGLHALAVATEAERVAAANSHAFQRLRVNVVQVQQFLTDASVTGDTSGMRDAHRNVQDAVQRISEIARADSALRARAAVLMADVALLEATGIRMMHAYLDRGRAAGNEVMKGDGGFDRMSSRLDSALTATSQEIDARGRAAQAEAARTADRVARMQSTMVAVLAVALGVFMLVLYTRILPPLRRLRAAVDACRESQSATTQLGALPGEFLELGEGVNALLASQRERHAEEHAAAVFNERVRQALDTVSTCVMLADADGTIVYLNETLRAMFRLRGGQIRQQLPHFDSDALLGTSFDRFHRRPKDTSQTIATLTKPVASEFTLGGAVLRVVATPVVTADGTRIGTVVQWIDLTDERATEREIDALVSSAIEGNLTVRLSLEGKAGFHAVLAEHLNALLENVTTLVRTTQEAAADVTAGAEEIARGNADLANRTSQEAQSLQRTTASMDRISAIVHENASAAVAVDDMVRRARQEAESGGHVVRDAVAAMSEISTSSRKIGQIIGVIDEIAFQTNLLALNAAIEAARAGDAGLSFAVVAGEVRSLAGRSADAAKEIKGLIEESSAKVNDGVRLVNGSGERLDAIVVAITGVAESMARIATSSREQTSGIEEVDRSMAEMDQTTQQNAALVEQASAASNLLSERARVLQEVVAQYQTIAERADPKPLRRAS